MLPATAPSLRSDGYLAIPGALGPPAVARLATALDRVYGEEVAGGHVRGGEAMHMLGGIGRDDLFLDLLDHPAVFPEIWRELGVSVPGRGNMLIVPGSHERNTLPRPDRPELGFDPPAGAEPVLASPGDAFILDRRLWHSRSDNLSTHTRRVVFLAYSFRWVRPRDDFGIDPSSERFRGLSPVRRQLLSEPTGRHHQ